MVSAASGFKFQYKHDQGSLPTALTLLWQLTFCMYMEDIGFSIGHRLLHTSYLYKKVHKIHHTYTQTISIAGSYTHPFEFFIGNMIPAILPIVILGPRAHIITGWTWSVLRIAESTNHHSGYDFPWVPWDLTPMRNTPAYHDFHHSGGDFTGNFSGQTTILDTLWGTNKKYYAMLRKHEKPE